MTEQEQQVKFLWELYDTGQAGIDYPETLDFKKEEAKILAQAVQGPGEVQMTCPECGMPRGDVRDGRCTMCVGDNFMSPL